MRLLEFSHADIDADPQQSAHIATRVSPRPATPAPAVREHPVRQRPVPEARVFPVTPGNIHTPARRSPIDLEHLQQRIDLLEKRIRMRVEAGRAGTSENDLEQLKQRLLKLERNLNSELWAAKQREYILLEMLAKPSSAVRIGKHFARLRSHSLPAVGHWFLAGAREWLQDRQPDWWPAFARAWKESLDDARNTFRPG